MNDSSIEQALAALADLANGDNAARASALRLLRDQLRPPLPSETATTTLISLLRDPNPTIRVLTAEVLGHLSDTQAIDPLLDTLFDSDVAVRVAVIDALGELKDHAAVSALLEAIYDESVYVRFAAANALGQIGDSRAVIDLIHMLDNDDIPIAMMAAQSLYKIGTPEALAAIQHLRHGDDYDFSVPPHLNLTQTHIPLPPKRTPKREDAPESAPINDKFAEVTRHIPDDVLQSLYDAEADADEREKSTKSITRASPLPAPSILPPPPPPPPPQAPPSFEEVPPPAAQPAAKPAAPSANPVQFSAYYPRETVPDVWYPLRAYIFRASAADAVATDAARELGGLLSAFREVVRTALGSVTTGALITATPELPGFQFNPPSAQIGFYEDWHRFDFKLRPTPAAGFADADQASNGHITFTVEGVIVADVPLSIYVGAAVPTADTSSVSAAIASATSPVYSSIFCSYSHRDTEIVERIERAYKALGLDFLRDVVTLKSGQDWNAELLEMIDRADIFQLFWSAAAADSKYVRQEWEYALNLHRKQGFIRPVYWEQPMPPVPPELGAIHFAYAPTISD